MSAETDRWTTIRDIHFYGAEYYRILGIMVFVGIGIFIGAVLFANKPDADGYTTNVYTEFMSVIASVIVTVFILDRRAEHREERRRIRDLQARLVREAGSSDNATALNAVREINAHGWLWGDDGVLKKADLMSANLAEAELGIANLAEGDLSYVNLAGANLQRANLEGAELHGANLKGANLWKANLEGANLTHPIPGELLVEAEFSKETVMPDGEFWTRDTDMRKYTHPTEWATEQQQAVDKDEAESQIDPEE